MVTITMSGKTFIQVSQMVKFWNPGFYLSVNYSGGLGVVPPSYGFYIPNAFGVGASYPFTLGGAWLSINAQFRYTAFSTPSHDGQVTFYFGRGFFNYRMFTAGSFVVWTENRNQGTEFTASLSGKKVAFFGDPQVWVKVKDGFSIGSRINAFYNLFGNGIKVYPTIGAQYKF